MPVSCCPAQVYKAVLDGTQPVAVKKLLRSDDHLDAKFLREISILKECRSTQVVQVCGPRRLLALFPKGASSCAGCCVSDLVHLKGERGVTWSGA